MLGIIIAMETECYDLMKNNFKDIYIQTIENKKFYIVKTNNDQTAIICFSGIGKVNAAIATSLIINNFNVKNVVNIGSCGIYKNLNVNDIMIVDKTSYNDVDVTAFNYEMNQVPKMPLWYSTNTKNNDLIKKLLQTNNEVKFGICLTGDSFINNNNKEKFNFYETNLSTVIDMECCAIAQTCFSLKVNFNAIKIGIDKLFEPISNQEQFNNNLVNVAKKIDNIVNNIIDMFGYSLDKN